MTRSKLVSLEDSQLWNETYKIALKEGPSDKTRAIACRDPWWALEYGCHIDQGPHPDTRAAACEEVGSALYYAKFVDEGRHPDTQAKAYEKIYWGLYYWENSAETYEQYLSEVALKKNRNELK